MATAIRYHHAMDNKQLMALIDWENDVIEHACALVEATNDISEVKLQCLMLRLRDAVIHMRRAQLAYAEVLQNQEPEIKDNGKVN